MRSMRFRCSAKPHPASCRPSTCPRCGRGPRENLQPQPASAAGLYSVS
jgi:hypothetical protein